jgi:hypothetical protein
MEEIWEDREVDPHTCGPVSFEDIGAYGSSRSRDDHSIEIKCK